MESDLDYMKLALQEAESAYAKDEVPVGSVIVSATGELLSLSHNLKELNQDPTAHSEVLAIRDAAAKLQSWRLNDCTLFVTLEPCSMCMGAIVHARIKRLVFGAYDIKGGAMTCGLNIHNNSKLNHVVSVEGGILNYECGQLLSQFFKEKRSRHKV